MSRLKITTAPDVTENVTRDKWTREDVTEIPTRDAVTEIPTPDDVTEILARDDITEMPIRDAVTEILTLSRKF